MRQQHHPFALFPPTFPKPIPTLRCPAMFHASHEAHDLLASCSTLIAQRTLLITQLAMLVAQLAISIIQPTALSRRSRSYFTNSSSCLHIPHLAYAQLALLTRTTIRFPKRTRLTRSTSRLRAVFQPFRRLSRSLSTTSTSPLPQPIFLR